jgi:hypothetical protein
MLALAENAETLDFPGGRKRRLQPNRYSSGERLSFG